MPAPSFAAAYHDLKGVLMRLANLLIATGTATLLGGCALFGPGPAHTEHYACDDGRTFALAVSPDRKAARIEFSDMAFGLFATPHDEPGELFTCKMLTVHRVGETASVDLEGAPKFSNCRVQRRVSTVARPERTERYRAW